jgi:hypothetical protein
LDGDGQTKPFAPPPYCLVHREYGLGQLAKKLVPPESVKVGHPLPQF